MKYIVIMTAMIAGQSQEFRIPMSPVFVHDQATCHHMAHRIARDYAAIQPSFSLGSIRCVRGS